MEKKTIYVGSGKTQIRVLASVYPNHEKQIEFKWNGKLCDWTGKETGKVIELR